MQSPLVQTFQLQQMFYEKEERSGGGTSLPRRKKKFGMDTSDFVAAGVLILAIGSVIVAIIVALGFVFGRVPAKEGSEIIIACVSGSATAGVVAALLGRKGKTTK